LGLGKNIEIHSLKLLKLTAKAPENRTSQKEFYLPTIHFQGPCRFQGGYIISLEKSSNIAATTNR